MLISGVSVAFAIFFGICSKQRNDKKDTQEETERRAENDTMVVVKLENIADDIKDIKRESRENREEMKQLRERVVIVEQSLKSYHKRLDGEQHVYDMFVARFTWLARVISFEAFSIMVDEALERMKKMLESNKAMQTLVSGEAGETVEKDM